MFGVTPDVRQFIRERMSFDIEAQEQLNPRCTTLALLSLEFKSHPLYTAYRNWMFAARVQYRCFIESCGEIFREQFFRKCLRPIEVCKEEVLLKIIELYKELKKSNRIYENVDRKTWHVSENLINFFFDSSSNELPIECRIT